MPTKKPNWERALKISLVLFANGETIMQGVLDLVNARIKQVEKEAEERGFTEGIAYQEERQKYSEYCSHLSKNL